MKNPKVVKSLTELRNEQINKVQEKGLKRLNDLFDALWEEAQGIKFLVTPNLRSNALPKNADKEGIGYIVEDTCAKCHQPVLKEPIEMWEVWKTRRDSGLLKYLFDQQVGRSNQKDKDVVDPEIILVFGDIESEPNNLNNKTGTPTTMTALNAFDTPDELGLPEN